METKRIYNLKRGIENPDDDEIMKFRHTFTQLPRKVDLRDKLPKVYNQGALGSCSAQACSAAYEYISNKPPNPSKLFMYYNARLLDGEEWVTEDAGSTLVSCIDGMKKFGVCPEKKWPYDISKFAIKPPEECYTKAKQSIVTEVNRVSRSLQDMKACLASNFPFVFGIIIFPSFEDPIVGKTGNVPLPGKEEKSLGGHAMLCCGYDDDRQVFICRNSWSDIWGDKGYCYIPYDYFTNNQISWNFYCIKKASR